MFHPYWPIIYVRGYAMTRGEIDDTTADPFCGFNLGSTVYRATTDRKKPLKFMFESPVLRLAADHGYATIFDAGLDVGDPGFSKACIPPRSIVVYRYYDEASRLLGTGETPPIEKFAADLGKLILKIKGLVCAPEQNPPITGKDFRCYLVAHSMGGLVCRTFLQDPKSKKDALACVDKIFTYATPHNGIDMAGMNVPSWMSASDMSNFNRKRMAKYLNLEDLFAEFERVDWLPQGEGKFDSRRFFCMIGTNRTDYEAGMGLSRAFAGNGSDGLVRIENASVWGIDAKTKQRVEPCATAYAYRAHSGYFGIVNSEEAYQNLVRFLFGDVRVDIWFDIDEVRMPLDLVALHKKGKVNALYLVEVMASPRNARWLLTRRVAEEDSVACVTLKDLTKDAASRSIYLSTIFLSRKVRREMIAAEAAKNRAIPNTISYAVTLAVKVPDYEVDKKLWPNEHFEGGDLYRDTSIIEAFAPDDDPMAKWNITHVFQSQLGSGGQPLRPVITKGRMTFTVPIEKTGNPGITGKLRFVVSKWNEE